LNFTAENAKGAEKRTLLFKRNRQYEAEGTGRRAEGTGHLAKSIRRGA